MKRLLILLSLVFVFTISRGQYVGVVAGSNAAAAAAAGNMITNGEFADATDWEVWGGCSIGSGVCTFDDVDDGDFKQADGDMVSSVAVSTAYTLTYDLSGTTGGGVYFKIMSYDGTKEYEGYAYYTNGTDKTIGFTTPDDISTKGIKFVCSEGVSASGGSFDNLVLEAD